MSGGIGRVQRDRRPRGLHRPVVLVPSDVHHADPVVRFGRLRVEFEGPLEGVLRLLQKLGHREQAALHRLNRAQRDPCRRVIRVVLDRPLEQQRRTFGGLGGGQPHLDLSLGERLVGFDRFGLALLDRADRGVAEFELHVLAQLVDDLVLEIEDRVDPAVELHGLQQASRPDFDELRGNPDRVAQPLERAADDPGRCHTAADLDRCAVVQPLPFTGAQRLQCVEDLRPPDDLQLGDILEIRGDRLGDSRADPVIGRLLDQVHERHDRDAARRRAGRGHHAARVGTRQARLEYRRPIGLPRPRSTPWRSMYSSRADW